MSRRVALLLFLLLTLGCRGIGQTLRGKVSDSTGGSSLEGAIVTLHRAGEEGEAPIAFALTDETGAFALSLPGEDPAALILRVRFTGYRSEEIALSAGTEPLQIRLTPLVEALPEVTVLGPPITAQGDTVSYRTEAFTTASTFTLEDLLKRLPGVTVSSSGLVRYNGKAIQGVYIEGKDLVADSYRTATRILRAEDIRSVEVMEHHQRVKVLQGIEEGDGAMLNIRLKDPRMTRPSGEVTGGAGLAAKAPVYDLSSETMLIRPSTQLLASLHSGNDGRPPVYDTEEARRVPAPDAEGLLALQHLRPEDLSAYPSSHHHGGTINQLFVLPHGSTLKYNAGLDHTARRVSTSVTRQLYDGGEAVSLRETRTGDQSEGEGYLTLTYLLNDSLRYLRNDLHVEGDIGRGSDAVERGTLAMEEREQHRALRLSDRLRLLRRTEERIKELQLYLSWSRTPLLRREVPRGPLAYLTEGKGSALELESSLAYGYFLTPQLVLNGDLRARLTYGALGISSLRSDLRGGGVVAETGPRLVYTGGHLTWSVGVPLALSLTRFTATRFLCRPGLTASLSYRPTASWWLHLKGGYTDREEPHLSDFLLGSYRVSLDRIVTREEARPIPRRQSLTATVDMEYRRPLQGFFVQWTLMGLDTKSNLQRDMRLDGTASEESLQALSRHTRTLHTDLTLSKYFSSLETLVRLTGGYDHALRPLILRGVESLLRQQALLCTAEVTTRPSDRWEVTGRLEGERQHESGTFGSETQGSFAYGLSLVYSPLERLSLHAEYRGETLCGGGQKRASLSRLDAGILYRSRRSRVQLSARNLLGAAQESRYDLDRGSRSMSARSLRGRQIILSYTLMY